MTTHQRWISALAPALPRHHAHRRLKQSALIWLLVVATTLTPAAETSPEDALIETLQAFLRQELAVDGQAIISIQLPPAQMPPCTSPQPFLPTRPRSAQGRISVGVRCGEQGQQVRYLQAQIDRYGEYPVLVRGITPGTQVTTAMLKQVQGNLSALPRESVLEADAIIGQVARRTLAAGVPLQFRQFETKPLVERGQQVFVEARGGNFRVSREGKALDSGALGDQVRVQFSNRDVINGRVVGKGKLTVDF